jgi:hypothetical protein
MARIILIIEITTILGLWCVIQGRFVYHWCTALFDVGCATVTVDGKPVEMCAQTLQAQDDETCFHNPWTEMGIALLMIAWIISLLILLKDAAVAVYDSYCANTNREEQQPMMVDP